MAASFAIQEIDIDPQHWTPVVAPLSCNNVAIRNLMGADVKIRTEVALAGSEDTIGPGVQEAIVAPISGAPFWRHAAAQPYRFMEGAVVAYVQSTSGVGAVKVRFVR